jgi:hypothetical protein
MVFTWQWTSRAISSGHYCKRRQRTALARLGGSRAKVMAANASANSTPHINGKLPIMERKKGQFPRGERVVDG